jgi:hypothetical protein
VCGRHAPQRRHRLLGARFVDVAHERVQQDDREDGDRLVGKGGVALDQPQCGGDRRRYQEQDHQRIGELSEKLLPSGHRRFGGQLVPAVALEPRPCLVFAQPEPGVAVERHEGFVGAYPVGFHSSHPQADGNRSSLRTSRAADSSNWIKTQWQLLAAKTGSHATFQSAKTKTYTARRAL